MVPENSYEVISLVNYMERARAQLVPELWEAVQASLTRLTYLLDVHTFSPEDVLLNQATLTWPEKIGDIIVQNENIVLISRVSGIACVCVCVCVVCVCVCVWMGGWAGGWVPARLSARLHACVSVYVRVCGVLCVCLMCGVCTCECVYVRVCVHASVCTCECVQVCVCAFVRAYMYACMHVVDHTKGR